MLYVNPLEGNTTLANASLDDPARRKGALQELEHTFVFSLLQEMRKTVDIDNQTPHTPERDIYEEMFDDSLSSEIAKSGQLGIARQMEVQMQQTKAALQAYTEHKKQREMQQSQTITSAATM